MATAIAPSPPPPAAAPARDIDEAAPTADASRSLPFDADLQPNELNSFPANSVSTFGSVDSDDSDDNICDTRLLESKATEGIKLDNSAIENATDDHTQLTLSSPKEASAAQDGSCFEKALCSYAENLCVCRFNEYVQAKMGCGEYEVDDTGETGSMSSKSAASSVSSGTRNILSGDEEHANEPVETKRQASEGVSHESTPTNAEEEEPLSERNLNVTSNGGDHFPLDEVVFSITSRPENEEEQGEQKEKGQDEPDVQEQAKVEEAPIVADAKTAVVEETKMEERVDETSSEDGDEEQQEQEQEKEKSTAIDNTVIIADLKNTENEMAIIADLKHTETEIALLHIQTPNKEACEAQAPEQEIIDKSSTPLDHCADKEQVSIATHEEKVTTAQSTTMQKKISALPVQDEHNQITKTKSKKKSLIHVKKITFSLIKKKKSRTAAAI